MEKIWDEIRIDDLEIYAHHGVFPEEREEGQTFYVNAILYADLCPAALNDDLTMSTNYGEVCEFLGRFLTGHNYYLIEAAAENAIRGLLLRFPNLHAVTLELRKPEAPIPMCFRSVSVKLHRGWHKVYVALGSNLGDRRGYLEGALEALREDACIRIKKVSSFLETKPYGGVEQGDFLNGVVEMETLYTPRELLKELQKLEQAAGRERTVHWGPRTLDLDILFYDDLIMEEEDLIIPHTDLQNRDFVLRPMAELAPRLEHPTLKKTIRTLWEEYKERENHKRVDNLENRV